jgi:dipeptidyl aminopeptidase/acylaminoacyl peptidase
VLPCIIYFEKGDTLKITTTACFLTILAVISTNGKSIDSLTELARVIPPVPRSITDTLSYYQNVHPATLYDCADGQGILMGIQQKETSQLFLQKHPGDTSSQLTFFSEPVFGGAICPDSKKHCILYGKDTLGNEIYQLYIFDLKTKESRMISDGKSQYDNYIWSPDGQKLAFSSTLRNGKDWDIYFSSIDSPSVAIPLIQKGGAWGIEDWSPDCKKLLVSQYISKTETRFFTINIDSGKLELIGDTLKPHAFENGKWANGNLGLFFTSDENSEFRVLYFYDTKTKKARALTTDLKWDVREIELSKSRRNLAFTTNENGFSSMYLMNTETFKIKKLNIPQGVAMGLHFYKSDKILLFTMNRPVATDNVYAIDLTSGKPLFPCVKKTDEPDTSDMISPEIIRYPTFDSVEGSKREITAFYYKPSKPGRHPCVITIHGGPESQFWPYYNPTNQYLCYNLGIAILAPNVRGSNGYGKTFLELDNGYKREDAVKDIGALLEWIKRQPCIDSNRIAVMGGSYGGYMSLASMTHYNNQLRAGIDIYGISNFITFLENTRESRRDLRRVEYGDERDSLMRKFLYSISPLNHVEKITHPMLIIQGANDPRVPVTESNQIVDALMTKKVPVWYLLFDNEGHGFNKKKNKDYEEEVIINFLGEYLK